MSQRGITLVRFGPKASLSVGRKDSNRLRITVEDPIQMSRFIFLHSKRIDDETESDEFHSIASPVGLTIYPVGAPDPEQTLPFFRKDFVDVILQDEKMVLTTFNAIHFDVAVLIEALDKLELLINDELIRCGEEAEESESESSSVSV